jgi:hypothetical protein
VGLFGWDFTKVPLVFWVVVEYVGHFSHYASKMSEAGKVGAITRIFSRTYTL